MPNQVLTTPLARQITDALSCLERGSAINETFITILKVLEREVPRLTVEYPVNPHDLKAAAEEIQAILKKYDIAAICTLISPGDFQAVRELSPSWSCAKVSDTPEGGKCLSLRAHMVDFPSKEAQQECISKTMGMLFGFQHQAQQDFRAMAGIIGEATKQMDVKCTITEIPPQG